jgi:serine/threonine protein phosphatase PrpC
MASLIGAATASPKSTVNQDYFRKVVHPSGLFSGLILADGIGSHFRAEVGAKFAGDKLNDLLERQKALSDLDFNALFLKVRDEMTTWALTEGDPDWKDVDRNLLLGTTLLCVLETENDFRIAYAGNGSIWHIDGGFNRFGPNHYLPWNAINLLNPHCVDEDGKAMLYRYLSVSGASCTPAVIRLDKNNDLPGDMIMLCTDGIYTNDQVQIGKDEAGSLWIRGEEAMVIFYHHLSALFKAGDGALTDVDISFALERYLADLKDKNLLHDDATIGLIISGATLRFHQQLFEKRAAILTKNEDHSS